MDAVALLGGNEYLVQQLLDRLLDAGFTTAQVIRVAGGGNAGDVGDDDEDVLGGYQKHDHTVL